MAKSISTPRELFNSPSTWQSWLGVEAALAKVQAALKIIPEEAAKEIAAKADIVNFDVEELSADINRTKAPVVSLTRFLAAACSGENGKYVHWGATTQNIIQTGRILQVRKLHNLTKKQLGLALASLADLAEHGSEMIMAGRTQRRHALPITFGFKVSGWIDELLRHLQRFDEFEPRFFCLQFGGAIGAMQSFGEHGPKLVQLLAEELELSPLKVPVRSSSDYLAEYVATMALYSTTCSKIAQELYTLMSDEIGEVAEGLGKEVIGSSTMPHKVNSKIANNILAVAARVRSQLGLALEGMQPSHEGDASANKMISEAVDTVCVSVYELTEDLRNLLKGLKLFPDRMLQNLQITNGLIVAENVMMTIAPAIGRQTAHDLVHEAALRTVAENTEIFDILMEAECIREYVSEEKLRSALDPANYIGHCVQITRDCVRDARIASEKLI